MIKCTERSGVYQAVKRLFDILASLAALAVLSPLFLVIAILILSEDGRPVFYKHTRVGKGGKTFQMYKFRTMYVQDTTEEKKGWTTKNDPRVTKVGRILRKTSIDELPQFFDVLRGDMSLVGTRPPTVDEYKQYESHHKRRLSMKPGITGLWQVSGRSDIEDFEDVVKLDVQYIDNWSLWGDIKILFKTVWVVFAGRGAK